MHSASGHDRKAHCWLSLTRTYPEDVPFVVDDMRRFYEVLPLGEIKALGKSHGFTSRLKWKAQEGNLNELETIS